MSSARRAWSSLLTMLRYGELRSWHNQCGPWNCQTSSLEWRNDDHQQVPLDPNKLKRAFIQLKRPAIKASFSKPTNDDAPRPWMPMFAFLPLHSRQRSHCTRLSVSCWTGWHLRLPGQGHRPGRFSSLVCAIFRSRIHRRHEDALNRQRTLGTTGGCSRCAPCEHQQVCHHRDRHPRDRRRHQSAPHGPAPRPHRS